jgi:hypothetical protein
VWRNGPHGHQLPDGLLDVNFVGNSNNGFHPNEGFNAGWNKPSFPFDNSQQGAMEQNFNRREPFPIKENVKDVITRSEKTMAKPKVKSKKMGPTDPVKLEEKVEAELRPEKEEENLGMASAKDISDTHLLPFPVKKRSMWKMKNAVTLWK